MRATWIISGVLAVLLLGAFRPVGAQPQDKADKPRNPFGVKDVMDPDGEDVRAFAAKVELAGDDKDPNAEQWVKQMRPGLRASLDGKWSERWNNAAGEEWSYCTDDAQVKVVGNR